MDLKQRSVVMSVSMHRKKEHITEMNCKKGILFQDRNSITVSIKMRYTSYWNCF